METAQSRNIESNSKPDGCAQNSVDSIDSVMSSSNADESVSRSHSYSDNSQSDEVQMTSNASKDPLVLSAGDHIASIAEQNEDHFFDTAQNEDEKVNEEESFVFVDALEDLHVNDSKTVGHLIGTDDDCASNTSEGSEKDREAPGLAQPFTRATTRGKHLEEEDDQGDDWREKLDETKIIENENTLNDEKLKAEEAQLSEQEKMERMKRSKELKEEGNEVYKQGNYSMAVNLYTDAIVSCLVSEQRDRAILYANRSAAKMSLDDMDAALEDCSRAVELDADYLKARLRRAEIYERLDKLDEALADYQKVLERDPSLHKARAACMRLPDQIEKRNEKLKAEMIDKLKDLGNLVLRPFGLSTDNFKLQQDPSTGGYSINFQQK